MHLWIWILASAFEGNVVHLESRVSAHSSIINHSMVQNSEYEQSSEHNLSSPIKWT